MNEEDVGSFFIVSKEYLSKIKVQDYQVILGISGFGNVGFLALNHIIETMKFKSFAYFGDHSWYYNENIESIITSYISEKHKTIIIVSRIPIFVSSVPQKIWDSFAREIISWEAKRYIVVGGLRESTRDPNSRDWVAYASTPKWTELYGHKRSLGDKLMMIGVLSSLLMDGTSHDRAVLGLLAYCNYEEDPEATMVALKEIKEICNLPLPDTKNLVRFDYSFFPLPNPNGISDAMVPDEEEEDDELPGFDLDDLI